ncbi:polyribonucleotide nucleotidyltransferase [Chitinispirillales bacterium ANBcel5]|uniref:polyribonucleotide nucleotidyltransferase n=1 Tax=Cellulosispirillum alkaliphilum TaxID=3039283 RepID=UPI002A522DCA|nr:polyribonucleotide nucleotidyltransferase [Chitinispirillales bacterium ANBcel5]
MPYTKQEADIDGLKVSLETGKLAKQADGSAIARLGDTMVLATACSGGEVSADFFPLSVEYIAKTYAAGKFPGGFIKREGRPSEKEILAARLVDRPIRPLFPKGYRNEVQIICTVISADDIYDADVLAITAASTALTISEMPFHEPVAAVRIGMVEGKLKVFPSLAETEAGQLDLVVAGTQDSIMMVEGGSTELPEETFVEAILMAHEHIKKLVAVQKQIAAETGKQKVEFVPAEKDPALVEAVKEQVKDKIHEPCFIGEKMERSKAMKNLLKEATEALSEQFPESEDQIASIFSDLEREDIRKTILQTSTRIAGRGLDEIRKITCELDLLPRAHGSALFTRGETQALVVSTLGTKLDEQHIDNIQGEYDKSYMLHYNFPPYSVGEVKRMFSVSRREVGHGHLAERSISPVLPDEKSFPYTIRVVSEILESNGSSSMASVCGASLSLMATGVPIKTHVAGVAMGLIKEGDNVAILTDILGTEDHVGDMDFKVAGTRDGITAIQMDIKIAGITPEIMHDALAKAKEARFKILDTMDEAISSNRKELSIHAPRISTITIDKEKIREVIGPSGKVIRDIQETTGTTIFIEDDGTIQIAATNRQQRDAALNRIRGIVAEPELNAIYEATVKTIVEFGAFVEFLPGKDGLIHISELDTKRVAKVDDILQVGDKVKVKLIGFDRFGKVKLSRKALL